MKKVKRQSVFETNSSSTHSLSIQKTDEIKKNYNFSFAITEPLQKIVWFICVCVECEENLRGKFNFFCGGKTPEEVRRDLVQKIRERYEEHREEEEWIFEAFTLDFDTWTIDDVNTLFSEEDDDHFWDTIYALECAESKDFVLGIKQRLIDAYCEAEHITEAEALDRIDKEYNEYNELVEAIADPKKHAKARWILRRINYLIDSDYNKAEDKMAVLEENKKRFAKEELGQSHDCYSCTRFFDEGSLAECECGFETYDKLLDEFSEYSDEEGIKKFLSPEIAVVGYEW